MTTCVCVCVYEQGWGTDHTLSSKQSADIVAFTALMEDKLLPALVSVPHITHGSFMVGLGLKIPGYNCMCNYGQYVIVGASQTTLAVFAN